MMAVGCALPRREFSSAPPSSSPRRALPARAVWRGGSPIFSRVLLPVRQAPSVSVPCSSLLNRSGDIGCFGIQRHVLGWLSTPRGRLFRLAAPLSFLLGVGAVVLRSFGVALTPRARARPCRWVSAHAEQRGVERDSTEHHRPQRLRVLGLCRAVQFPQLLRHVRRLPPREPRRKGAVLQRAPVRDGVAHGDQPLKGRGRAATQVLAQLVQQRCSRADP
mmetsp:Transcript_61140/g.169192  ORF Transcript_61140/g.169192 Transcript_61140/m.169192 type:complete len:219 (+) Transcript_61140:161-817(+)